MPHRLGPFGKFRRLLQMPSKIETFAHATDGWYVRSPDAPVDPLLDEYGVKFQKLEARLRSTRDGEFFYDFTMFHESRNAVSTEHLLDDEKEWIQEWFEYARVTESNLSYFIPLAEFVLTPLAAPSVEVYFQKCTGHSRWKIRHWVLRGTVMADTFESIALAVQGLQPHVWLGGEMLGRDCLFGPPTEKGARKEFLFGSEIWGLDATESQLKPDEIVLFIHKHFQRNAERIEMQRLLSLEREAKKKRKLDRLRMLYADPGPKTRREQISEDIQMFVWNRDGGKCVKCGSNQRLEFDHIIPVVMGGSNTARNLQLLCEVCNRQKGGSL
jgi:hypothetical protein